MEDLYVCHEKITIPREMASVSIMRLGCVSHKVAWRLHFVDQMDLGCHPRQTDH